MRAASTRSRSRPAALAAVFLLGLIGAHPVDGGERRLPRAVSVKTPRGLALTLHAALSRGDYDTYARLFPDKRTIHGIAHAAVIKNKPINPQEIIDKGTRHMARKIPQGWQRVQDKSASSNLTWSSARLLRVDIVKMKYPAGPKILEADIYAYFTHKGQIFTLDLDDCLHFEGRWYLADDMRLKGPLPELPPKKPPKVQKRP